MSYPPATPPGGYNPYGEESFPAPSMGETPQPETPPGYPFGGAVSVPHPPQVHYPAMAAGAPALNEKNGLGTGALVTGILSMLLCFTLLLSLPLGVVAVVLGSQGRKYSRQGRANNQSVATAGMVTGIIGILVGLLGWIILYSAAIEA